MGLRRGKPPDHLKHGERGLGLVLRAFDGAQRVVVDDHDSIGYVRQQEWFVEQGGVETNCAGM